MQHDQTHKRTNEEILEELINELGSNIKRLIYTYVKDWSIAEDITQEVFISCYKNMNEFRGESSYKTWLYKIAINKSKDFLKSKWFRLNRSIHNVMDKYKSIEQSVDEQVIINEDNYQLSVQVLKLPEKYKEVIILFYYEGLKVHEIEYLTGIKQETVKTRLMRARKLLYKKLGGNE